MRALLVLDPRCLWLGAESSLLPHYSRLSPVASVAEEFFDGCEFGFRHVQILLGGFGVLFLHGGLCFAEVGPHALLGGDDVATEAVTGSSLLALDIIQRCRDGGGAAVDVVVTVLVFFDSCGFLGFGLGVGLRGLVIFLGFRGRRLFSRLGRSAA